MKRLLSIAFALFACALLAQEPNVTNTVLTVDQWGNLNVAGVASVSDVATNAVRVQIAEAKADAAASTAQSVTNQLQGIVDNIMANNVVIYRSGYTDAFEGLVVYTDDDKIVICEYEKVSLSGGVLRSRIGYVCTVDLGTTKPVVMANDTLAGGTEEFSQVASANVTTPVIHNESKTIGGSTYSKWYEIYVDVPVEGTANCYFYFIKLEADTPSGDGSALALPNGVYGGQTTTVTWGDKVLRFEGGVLTGVSDAP